MHKASYLIRQLHAQLLPLCSAKPFAALFVLPLLVLLPCCCRAAAGVAGVAADAPVGATPVGYSPCQFIHLFLPCSTMLLLR